MLSGTEILQLIGSLIWLLAVPTIHRQYLGLNELQTISSILDTVLSIPSDLKILIERNIFQYDVLSFRTFCIDLCVNARIQ